MMAEEVEPHKIALILGKSMKTIENWHHQYLTKGIASLNSFQYKPKQSFLSLEHTEEIVDWIKKNNPGKIKEVQQFIKDQFKIQYSHEAVRKILKKNGLKFLKPKVVPGNPPTETEQKNCRTIFQIESREPRGHCFLIWRWDAFNPDIIHTGPKMILFLDNAKYFKARIVTDWLDKHPKLEELN